MASGFANIDAQWWMLPGGSALNAGCFDATVAGAVTNYANQTSPVISSTTGTCTVGSTTWTDPLQSFTSALIGNGMRVSAATGGTGTALDYFIIIAVPTGTTLTLDRSPDATSIITAATYRIGGAHASIGQYSLGGTATDATPTLATPLIPGNIINIGGSGGLDSGTIDYDFSSGFYELPGGNYLTTGGSIKLIGFNGRPNIKHAGLLSFSNSGTQGYSWWVKHCKFTQSSTPNFTNHACFDSTITSFYDTIHDVNGVDSQVMKFGNGANQSGGAMCFEIRNSGSTAAGAGTNFGIEHTHGGGFIYAGWIHGLRSNGVVGIGVFGSHHGCIIANNKFYGYSDAASMDPAYPIPYAWMNNTFDANGSGAMNFVTYSIANHTILNNIFSNHTTAATAAITYADTAQLNAERYRYMIGYNDYFNNTANFNSISATPTWTINPTQDGTLVGDLTLDPQYVAAGSGNYTTGANVKAKGLACSPNMTTTPYTLTMGAMY